ncbi:MAG: TonB-dependent receptor [Candidatus Azobacteroides sp.]|nr:TonB-dependent receptor [Candidatus Azobacteroides sp.]
MKQKKIETRQAYRFKRFAHRAYAVFNSMHKVVSIGVVTSCMLTFAHVTQTSAQENRSVQTPVPEQELEELVVTSSKAELTFNQTAKSVTVITREEIARQPAQSIQDLLKSIVGLDVRQRGANGVLSDISVRGSTFDQVAILLDGANLTNPQTGHYSLDLPVNLSDIERIEIIQGPASLIYGAGAFSGGINIITKKDSDTGVFLKAEGGMHELWGAESRASLKTNTSTHSLSAGYNSSDGYIPDSDYKILNAFWQSNFYADNSHLNVQLGFNDKAYGANTFYSPSYFNQFDDTRSLFASVKGESGTKLKFIPHLYWSRHYDCFQLYRNGTPDIPSWYTGHNYHYSEVLGFNLNTQYKWKGGITNFGGELRNEGVFSNVLGKPLSEPIGKYTKSDNRTNTGYFLEHIYIYQGFTFSAGILANYNSFFKKQFEFYPNIDVAYWWSNHLKTFASWNNATRMPTFTDLYYSDPSHEGNPDLQPEKSKSFELGSKYAQSWLIASLTGFYTQGNNLIDWIKERPDDPKWKSQNLTTVNKIGFEAHASLFFRKIVPALTTTRLDLSYMYIDQTKKSGELFSGYVLDYLRHKFVAGLSHPVWKELSVDWQFRWQKREGSYSKYENGSFTEEAYPAFALLDVKLNRKINLLNIYLSVNNLFDKSYYDTGNLPQPGFWLVGGVSWSLK